jgi:hypothetical protein
VQIGVDGKKNVFYYPTVFWLAQGDESAWLSPNSPRKQKYIDRVASLARTGADAVWIDVPVYFDTVIKWSDFSKWGKDAFKSATGLEAPSRLDWDNNVS